MFGPAGAQRRAISGARVRAPLTSTACDDGGMVDYEELPWPDRVHETLSNPYPIGSVGRLTSFRSARAKLKRVKEVVKTMRLDAEGLRLDFWAVLRVERSVDGAMYRFVVDEPPALPSIWPVTTGEVLYNLRSALDHAAFELSVIGLGRDLTPKEAEGSQFPLYDTCGKFAKNVPRQLPGVADEVLALIERVQPYPERDSEHYPSLFDEAAYLLGVLNRLGNVEKHRHPHLVVHSVDGPSWQAGYPEPRLIYGPIEQGRVFAEMDYYPEYVPYQSMQPRFTFRPVLIDDDGPLSMPGVLHMMCVMVERVLDVIDPSPWFDGRREELTHRTTP